MRIANLSEALASVDFLHKRELLCGRCGWRLASVGNQFISVCETCRPAHGHYEEMKGPANGFERLLVQALHKWFSEDDSNYPPADRGDTPGTAAPAGQGGAP